MNTRTKYFLPHLVWMLTLIASCGTSEHLEETTDVRISQPNIVLIFVDDLGYSDLGVYGSESIRTPVLDEMAAEGLRFTNFYAQPICGPSRAALLTGSYPIRVAEPGNKKNPNSILHPREITIAEALQAEGYETAVIGKWHMAGNGEDPWDFAPPPQPAGRPGGFGPFKPELMPNAQGFDYFYGLPMYNGYTREVDLARFVPQLMRNEEVIESPADMDYLTKNYTAETIAFIRENRDRPFFVYLAHHMPHLPLGASPDFKGASNRGPYGDAVEELDWSVGEIMRELERLDLDEETLVVFLSDNGPEVGHSDDYSGSAGPLRGGKYSNWEGGLRVPAIMRWPGRIPAGIVSDALATSMDFYPTFVRLSGGVLPADVAFDGMDLGEVLSGDNLDGDPNRVFYYYSLTQLQGVRSGRWKLVLPRETGTPYTLWIDRYSDEVDEILLFDLEEDIAEENNLAEAYPEIVAQLLLKAEEARSELGDYDQIGEGARFFDEGAKRPVTFFPKPVGEDAKVQSLKH